MKVYLLMGGDFPNSVWSSAADAEAEKVRLKQQDELNCPGQRHPHYKVYEMDVGGTGASPMADAYATATAAATPTADDFSSMVTATLDLSAFDFVEFSDLEPKEPSSEKFVPMALRSAANLYEERNAIYGDNYKRFGATMLSLFPDGLTLNDAANWNRLGILVQMVAKLTRYAPNFNRGGHNDSLDDLTVYSMMLMELDSDAKQAAADEKTSHVHGGIDPE